MERSLSATGRTRGLRSTRQFAPRNRLKRSTDSAVRCGGFAKGVKRSSVESAHTPGSGATASSAGPLGLRCGSRASTRSCSATTLQLVAGGPRGAPAPRRAPGVEQGWLDLARSEGSRESGEAATYAAAALNAALAAGDPDLELRALAQLGFARVSGGEVDDGLEQLDEAMAAATSGEPASLETFADICSRWMLACERAGDVERPQQWSSVLEDFVRKYDHVVLLAFCRTCCADVFPRTAAWMPPRRN